MNRIDFKFSRRKQIIIISIIVLILISVIVGLSLSMLGRTKEKNIKHQLLDILETTDVSREEESVAEQIYQRMEFEVQDVTKEDCVIVVTAPDINKLFFSIFEPTDYSEPTSKEEYDATINQILQKVSDKLVKGDYSSITQKVKVPIDKNGQVKVTYELADAFYGGVLTAQQNMLNMYLEEGSNE